MKSLDFVGWNGELYVVDRNGRPGAASSSSSLDLKVGSENAATSSATTHVGRTVELKELPSRRRLDWGKGVDLGGEDAVWLEGKDVPMDYDMPVGSASGAGVEAS